MDDRQAVITFRQPYAEWQGQFAGEAFLFPKSVTADPEAFNKSLVDFEAVQEAPLSGVAGFNQGVQTSVQTGLQTGTQTVIR